MIKLLGRLVVLAVMVLGTLLVQHLGDSKEWKLPWYLIHEGVLLAIPMAWLLIEVYPRARKAEKLAFLCASAVFVLLGSAFELVAIQQRFWWFYTARDGLSGIQIGTVAVEEFIYYPLILNIPILLYGWLIRRLPEPKPALPWSRTRRIAAGALAGAALAGGLVLLVLALGSTTPPLDRSIMPTHDAAGVLRYAAGPPRYGWTIIQLLALGSGVLAYARLRARVHRPALLLVVALFVPYAFFLELMACGRGWWVWNQRQVTGLFTGVLPIDSYLMYLTGALLPVLCYVALLPVFAGLCASERRSGVRVRGG